MSPILSPISQRPTPLSTSDSSQASLCPILDGDSFELEMPNCPQIQTWVPPRTLKRRSGDDDDDPFEDKEYTSEDSDYVPSGDESEKEEEEEEVKEQPKQSSKARKPPKVRKPLKCEKPTQPKRPKVNTAGSVQQEKEILDAIEIHVNKCLPVRIRYPSARQNETSPGPVEHTGVVQAFRNNYHKPGRGGYIWEFVISFEDPLCNLRKNGKLL